MAFGTTGIMALAAGLLVVRRALMTASAQSVLPRLDEPVDIGDTRKGAAHVHQLAGQSLGASPYGPAMQGLVSQIATEPRARTRPPRAGSRAPLHATRPSHPTRHRPRRPARRHRRPPGPRQKINKPSRRPSKPRRDQDRFTGIDNCSGMTMLGQRPIMLRVWLDHPQDGAVNRQHSPKSTRGQR